MTYAQRAVAPALWLTTLGYLLMVVALSLHPFEGWRAPPGAPWDFLFEPLPRYRTQFDLWTNLLAYWPLGLLLSSCLRRLGSRRGALLALLACVLLSCCMECAQSYLPTRRAQWLDLLANSVGAALGCLVWAASQGGRMMRAEDPWASTWTHSQPRWFHSLGVWGLLGVWCLVQAAPMNLWLQLGSPAPAALTARLAPLFVRFMSAEGEGLGWAGQIFFESCFVGLNLSGLCLLLSLALEPPGRAGGGSFRPWGRLVLATLVVSLLARTLWASLLHPLGQQPLGAGIQAGLFLGLLLAAAGLALPARGRGILSIALIAVALLLAATLPATALDPALTSQWSAGRWQNLRGASGLAAHIWPWLAMAWTLLWLSQAKPAGRRASRHKMRR